MHHNIGRASVATIYSIASSARGTFELQVPGHRRVSDDPEASASNQQW